MDELTQQNIQHSMPGMELSAEEFSRAAQRPPLIAATLNEVGPLQEISLPALPDDIDPDLALPRAKQRSGDLMNRFALSMLARLPDVTFDLPEEPHRFFPSQERYRELAQPMLIPGLTNLRPVLFVGGLGVAGRTDWARFADYLHQRYPAYMEIHSMRGHEGSWSNLLNVKWQDWVGSLIAARDQMVQRFGMLPLVVTHSTASNVAILANEVCRKELGAPLAAGMVTVAPPVELRSSKHSLGLAVANRQHSKYPESPRWEMFSVRRDTSGLLKEFGGNSDDYGSCTFYPVKLLLQLRETQLRIKQAIKAISVPTFVVQGVEDDLVTPGANKKAFAGVPSATYEPMQRAAHSCMFGASRARFFQLVSNWLMDNQDHFKSSDPISPSRN